MITIPTICGDTAHLFSIRQNTRRLLCEDRMHGLRWMDPVPEQVAIGLVTQEWRDVRRDARGRHVDEAEARRVRDNRVERSVCIEPNDPDAGKPGELTR